MLLVAAVAVAATAARSATRTHRTQPPARDGVAVAIARAHVDAWSHHDWERARRMLAPDVQVTVTTTQSLPPVHLLGVDQYMDGLKRFAGPIEPGSAKVTAAIGDDHNALLLVTALSAGPHGTAMKIDGARLYLVDNNKKIKAEQVVFFVAPK